MPYSAVTHPRPWPLSHGGMRSSRLAVQLTWVLPNLMRHEPSACIDTARSIETRRSSSGLRLEGRMGTLLSFGPRARARVPRTLGDEGPAFNRKRTANGGPFDELQCA